MTDPVDALRSAFDFADLDDQTLSWLAESAEIRGYQAGERVFDKGSEPDGLYVVVGGRVRIEDSVHGREIEIAEIGPGDFFGELSLALHTARTRAARAAVDSQILVLPLDAVRRLSAARPHLEEELMAAFEERMPMREDLAGE